MLDEIKSLDRRLNGKSKTWLNYIKTLLKNLRNLKKGKTISKLIKMAKLYQTLSKNLAKLKVLPFCQIQNEFRQATLILRNLNNNLIRNKEFSELELYSEYINNILTLPLRHSYRYLFHRVYIKKKLLITI